MGHLGQPRLLGGVAPPPGGAEPPAPPRQPTERYLFVKELHKSVLEYGYSLARWVMASLLLLNGGALAVLAGVLKDYPSAAGSGRDFVWGAIFAVLTGIFAWLNCSAIAGANSDRLDFVAFDTQDPKSADVKDYVAWALAIAAFGSAFYSLGLFAIGCDRIADSVAANVAAQNPLR